MCSRPARNCLRFTVAAVISAAALVLALRSWQEVSALWPAGHARPEPASATPCSERSDSSLDSPGPCAPPAEALPGRSRTTRLAEWTANGLVPAHSSDYLIWSGQAPDPLPGVHQTAP